MKTSDNNIRQVFGYLFSVLALVLSPSAFSQLEGYDGVLEQDSLALVAFYTATGGPDWTSNTAVDFDSTYIASDWDYTGNYNKWFDGPVKDWFGVTVEEVDGDFRVTRLWPSFGRRSEGDNNMVGYIPKEVGYLTALKWFHIPGNGGLEGSTLPGEIFHPTLERLDVEYCFLGGVISDEFRNCTAIDYIDLRYNNFEDIPLLDFLSSEHLLEHFSGENNSIIFLYSTKLSFAALEPNIDYFYTISDVPAKIRIEMRDCNNVGIEKEIIVTSGSSVDLENYDMGTQGTGTWLRNGLNTYITGNTFNIPSVSDADTGYYQVQLTNDYVKSYDQNTNYGAVYTKRMYVRYNPVAPQCTGGISSYNGKKIRLTFSKPMAIPAAPESSGFVVRSNGSDIAISGINLTGRLSNELELVLDTPVGYSEDVTVNYSPGTIVCENGGVLASFTDFVVENRTRDNVPQPVSAITRVDGKGIYLTFDENLDEDSFTPSDFSINANTPNEVVDIQLQPGLVEEQFSTTILLITANTIVDSTDTISVNHNAGTLSALYGAAAESFDDFPVENVVNVQTIPTTLIFEDGINEIENVVIYGNISLYPFLLYDDGTNGDETPGDGIWTSVIDVVEGDYYWSVYERKTEIVYDTSIVVDPETGVITTILTPVEEVSDSLLSDGYELEFSVADFVVTGDTTFSIRTNSLVFVLLMDDYVAEQNPDQLEPYLMGINDDWTEGLAMSPLETDPDTSDYDYYVSVTGFSLEDIVYYNFRNNEQWENTTPHKRIYDSVHAEVDTIIAEFGVVETKPSTLDRIGSSKLSVYPNPIRDVVIIEAFDRSIERIEIFNSQGQLVHSTDHPDSVIDVAHLQHGFYVIKAIDDTGTIYLNKILKLNL